ncbi:hypothetical protein DL93DRAFT_2093924 [Clavulina sp. PMI_390]|nr:hypothetical protein DL93DRAFT_2093924 [Clavulina sp. PMI_390]
MTSTLDPSTINIDNLLGVILVCLIIAAYLFGMSSSQAYIYYDRFPRDKWQIKALVAVVWLLDTLHTALMSHTAYYYTVTNFGNFLALDEPPTFSFNLEILIVPILAFIVQSYFAYRAFSIERKHWPLSVGVMIFAVLQLVAGILACVVAFTKFDGFLNLKPHTWALTAWLSSGAVADLMVTVSLFISFYVNKTAFSDDDGWTTRVLMYGVHTGLLTSITTIIDLAFVVAWPHTLAFAGLNYILGKLYTNTLLYALNRRPISDPRYQSNNSSHNKSKSGQNSNGPMPSFGLPSGAPNPHSLSAPRVAPKDPYAPGYGTETEFMDGTKSYAIGDHPDDVAGRKIDLHQDRASEHESAFVAAEKDDARDDLEHTSAHGY